MFSNLTVGFLMGLGVSGWVYNKMMHSTGNNTKNALIVATIAGVFSMILIATIMGMIVKK